MEEPPPFVATPTGDGTLWITAFSDDSPDPIQMEVDASSAVPLRDGIDAAISAQARGAGGAFGPVHVSGYEVTVVATERGVRLTVARAT